MIELHQKLLADKIRNKAFNDTLKRLVKKDKTVLADIGSGTGFLGFLASKLGAKECHLYENSYIIELSRLVAAQNKIKNCKFIPHHSMDVVNPIKADVVISETLGNYALEENIMETLMDAKRFLKNGGTMVPNSLEQFIAPVSNPRIINAINAYDNVGFGLNLNAVRNMALNNMYVYDIKPSELLQANESVKKWDSIDFTKKESSIRTGRAYWTLEKPASIYGFAVWWKCELVPGIEISISPFDKKTHWDQIFLPLTEKISANKGNRLEISLMSDTRMSVGVRLTWETVVLDGEKIIKRIKMDTKNG